MTAGLLCSDHHIRHYQKHKQPLYGNSFSRKCDLHDFVELQIGSYMNLRSYSHQQLTLLGNLSFLIQTSMVIFIMTSAACISARMSGLASYS